MHLERTSGKNAALKNEVLFARARRLVATERRIGVAILECLYEIERRKAYAELKVEGLYTYCVKELGFTDAQAYQRIQAMRALKELPELRPMIESGALSVSSVSKVQTHFRKERKDGRVRPKAEKLGLFALMENRTSREVDAKLAEFRGEKPKTKLVLEMDEELEGLWKRVKDLAAHRSGGDEAETLKVVAREWLKKNDPKEREIPKKERPAVETSRRVVPLSTRVSRPRRTRPKAMSRSIPSPLRRKIWLRDEGKCVRCGSRHALEIDHVLPFALGSETSEENLRLVCRPCNGFLAVKSFGMAAIVPRIRKCFIDPGRDLKVPICNLRSEHGRHLFPIA
jgi:hypothetical protein